MGGEFLEMRPKTEYFESQKRKGRRCRWCAAGTEKEN